MAISVAAIEPAIFTLPVKMKLNTKVSMLPVILQVIVLTMDRGWESPVRINGSFMFFPIFPAAMVSPKLIHPFLLQQQTFFQRGRRVRLALSAAFSRNLPRDADKKGPGFFCRGTGLFNAVSMGDD